MTNGASWVCAGALGARGVVIHPVPNPRLVPDSERPELHGIIADATRRSLDDLVPVARAAGVRMLLENLPYKWDFPFFDMTELRHLVDDYPEEAVGLIIDTGHAWTVGKHPADESRAAGERLHGTHLQDVDAEHPRDDHWVPVRVEHDGQLVGSEVLMNVDGYRSRLDLPIRDEDGNLYIVDRVPSAVVK